MNVIVPILVMLGPVFAGSTDLAQATKLYHATDYDAVLRVLTPESESNRDPESNLLIGKALFMKGEFKKASESFERAVQQEPAKSEYNLWLGRAYGRRAETSSFVTAPGFASKARQSFEKAVELDPNNGEAVNDLFEYYKEAPGFMGGGLDKAQNLLGRIKTIDAAEYHFGLAQLAEKRKEYGIAEQQFRKALDLAPRQVGRVIDLAKFLYKRGRYPESEELFNQAETIAPDDPKLLFARAKMYVQSKRNLNEARTLLKKYIASPLITPDNPPRQEARKLLNKADRGG